MKKRSYRILHLFCGIGGSALGTGAASVRFGEYEGVFECVGGVDIDPLAVEDYKRLTGGRAVVADLHTMSPQQLLDLCGHTAPDVVMMSPPCKGFSGLLAKELAATEKYQTMNRLLLDALFLVTSTWLVPPRVIFIENVPRIAARGKELVRQARTYLEGLGFACHEGNHDCGEIGELGQRRRRYFFMARHVDSTPHFVYLPPKKRVRACGEILGPLPVPGDTVAGGPMHTLPQISWQNWVRLSLIPPGGDWRDLAGVLAKGQKKREQWRRHILGKWDEPVDTVTGPGGSAAENVADPRVDPDRFHGSVETDDGSPGGGGGVRGRGKKRGRNTRMTAWTQPTDAVTGNGRINGSGAAAVADVRVEPFGHCDRVTSWDQPIGAVTHSPAPSSGAAAAADPRVPGKRRYGSLGVEAWNEPSGTVTSADPTSQGGRIVAEPLDATDRWKTVLGVTAWDQTAATVTGEGSITGGRSAVADPRIPDPGHLISVHFVDDISMSTNNPNRFWNKYAVAAWDEPAKTVIGAVQIGSGAPSVADPRPMPGNAAGAEILRRAADDPSTLPITCRPRAGAYKVMSWEEASATVSGSFRIDNGPATVADPSLTGLKPKRPPPFIPVIIAADGTWHRPLTTFELAALQGFPLTMPDGSPLVLAGDGHTRWRMAIGNAVPPPAAKAVAEVLLAALLLSELGQERSNGQGVWVRKDDGDAGWAELMQ